MFFKNVNKQLDISSKCDFCHSVWDMHVWNSFWIWCLKTICFNFPSFEVGQLMCKLSYGNETERSESERLIIKENIAFGMMRYARDLLWTVYLQRDSEILITVVSFKQLWELSKVCTVFENHPKCRIWILAFFTNFCPLKSNLSGNTVWP